MIEGELSVPQIDPALDWEIRARLDTFGNDPDSGFVDIRSSAAFAASMIVPPR